MKKGISNIVVSVLLILVALIAIGIIWFFVRPFLTNSSSEFASGALCLQTQLNPVGCTYIGGEANGWYAILTVTHGSDKSNLSDIAVVFNTQTADQKLTQWSKEQTGGSIPGPLESSTALFSLGMVFPNKVSIGGILEGNKAPCALSPAITCKKYVYLGGVCPDFDNNDFIDGNDYDAFTACYDKATKQGTFDCPVGLNADVTHDGFINSEDLAAFLEAFEKGTTEAC
jgi:FlaG/FlaF family flagellin (archaellin)